MRDDKEAIGYDKKRGAKELAAQRYPQRGQGKPLAAADNRRGGDTKLPLEGGRKVGCVAIPAGVGDLLNAIVVF